MAKALLNRNMRLFGLPYQFHMSVDPRISTVSKTVGRKFVENIILDAPVISIIPGKPAYLPGVKDRYSMTQQLLLAADDTIDTLKGTIKENVSNKEKFRYYDFERSYTEYMQYVNILCRTAATFLELDEYIDGVSCQRYDYSNYRWFDGLSGRTATENIAGSLKPDKNKIKNQTSNGKNVNLSMSNTTVNTNSQSHNFLYETPDSGTDEANINDLITSYTFVQFMIDSDASSNESMSNATSESQIKGIIDQGSGLTKEIAFAMNSGGMDNAADVLGDFAQTTSQTLTDKLGSTNLNGILSRVISLSDNVLKGENVIMPDIYQNSSYDKSYSFTVHLKTPYGTPFGYFMDICVPLMHLLALAIPRQTTANTYGSPFLVKAFCDGIFTCNLGIVSSISISKGINNAFSVDGLPTEVDVSVQITDLYSDISMSPQNDPILFINNSSLLEYLATTCGLSLVTPNIDKKFNMIISSVTNAFLDIPSTVVSKITEAIDKAALNFLGLSF